MDTELSLTVLVSVAVFALLAVFVMRKLAELHGDDVERAKQLLCRLPAERILDDPRILCQPEIPEQISTFIAVRRIRDILSRDPINEVSILPMMQQPGENRISRMGGNILAALVMNTLLWELCLTLIGEIPATIGFTFFCVSILVYILWRARTSNALSRDKAERLLRRMTRSEITEVLQLAKRRMEAPDKQTDKTLFSPPIR